MTFCATPDDAFRAGWEAAEGTPPLTQTQVDRLVLLHRPYLLPAPPPASPDARSPRRAA